MKLLKSKKQLALVVALSVMNIAWVGLDNEAGAAEVSNATNGGIIMNETNVGDAPWTVFSGVEIVDGETLTNDKCIEGVAGQDTGKGGDVLAAGIKINDVNNIHISTGMIDGVYNDFSIAGIGGKPGKNGDKYGEAAVYGVLCNGVTNGQISMGKLSVTAQGDIVDANGIILDENSSGNIINVGEIKTKIAGVRGNSIGLRVEGAANTINCSDIIALSDSCQGYAGAYGLGVYQNSNVVNFDNIAISIGSEHGAHAVGLVEAGEKHRIMATGNVDVETASDDGSASVIGIALLGKGNTLEINGDVCVCRHLLIRKMQLFKG